MVSLLIFDVDLDTDTLKRSLDTHPATRLLLKDTSHEVVTALIHTLC